MKWWPWKKTVPTDEPVQHVRIERSTAEPSAMDRLMAGTTDRDIFALLFAKLLEERMPGVTMSFTDQTALRLVNAEGKDATIYLDNVWNLYSRGEHDRRALLERYAGMSDVIFTKTPPLQREGLVPLIKDLTYVEHFDKAAEVVTEHLVADLWIVYAEDLPDRTQTVSRKGLESAGIAKEGLRKLAVSNLLRVLPEVQRHGVGPWYSVTAGDYTASLLLVAPVWEQLAEVADGDVVAVVPARDVLLVTGSNSREGIAALRQRASQIVDGGDHVISKTLLVRVGDEWKLFDPN